MPCAGRTATPCNLVAWHSRPLALRRANRNLPQLRLGRRGFRRFSTGHRTGGAVGRGQIWATLLATCKPPEVDYPLQDKLANLPDVQTFGLESAPVQKLTWPNGPVWRVMTRGEKHLRQEVDFGSPTRSGLNLGDEDWTVEFWFAPEGRRPTRASYLKWEKGRGAPTTA